LETHLELTALRNENERLKKERDEACAHRDEVLANADHDHAMYLAAQARIERFERVLWSVPETLENAAELIESEIGDDDGECENVRGMANSIRQALSPSTHPENVSMKQENGDI
jgi:uncharacterized coiled-coil DUF342 family protein